MGVIDDVKQKIDIVEVVGPGEEGFVGGGDVIKVTVWHSVLLGAFDGGW